MTRHPHHCWGPWTPWTPPWWWGCKPCFHRSTKLLTKEGALKPVYDIRAGDVLHTSKGDQKVLWVGSYTATEDQPIYRIRIDGRTIRVSKHHRTQIGRKLMTPLEMVKADMDCAQVCHPSSRDMFHVLTERHALVMSDSGIWSETLFLGGNQAPAIMGSAWATFAHLHESHKAAMAAPAMPPILGALA